MALPERTRTLYEAIEALPEGVTGEIIHGQLYTQPRPSGPHTAASSRMGMRLGQAYDLGSGGPGGWWILVEPEIHFVRDTEILVPDLAGWRRSRMPTLPQDQRFEVVPDWVCEVLSPATASKDRQIKMPVYATYKVGHAWLVDPREQTLEAYQLEAGEWAPIATFAADDTVAAEPFPEARFRVADLWR